MGSNGGFPYKCAGTACLGMSRQGFASPYKQGYQLEGVSLTDDALESKMKAYNNQREGEICAQSRQPLMIGAETKADQVLTILFAFFLFLNLNMSLNRS